jgi:hypothetical protein
LFFIAAAVGAVIITNPAVPAEPVPCQVAGLCRDRHDAHPQLIMRSEHHGGLFAADDPGS